MSQLPPHKQSILRERAQKLLTRKTTGLERALYERVAVIETGRERVGLPLSRVREITRAYPISPLPQLPAYMLGVSAVRGELLSVLDLAELRGSGRTGSALFFAVVAGSAGRVIALSFSALLEMRDVFRDELVTGLPADELARTFTHSMTHDSLSILDVDQLLSSERVRVGQHDPRSGTTTKPEQTP